MKTIGRILAVLGLAAWWGVGTAEAVYQWDDSIVVLEENFEKIFPGHNGWLVGDDSTFGTTAYWGDVKKSFGGEGGFGSWKGYCAGVGYGGTTNNPTYQNGMSAYMKRVIDLTEAVTAKLSFYYKVPSLGVSADQCRVYYGSTLVWTRSYATVGDWINVQIDLSAFVGTERELKFQFTSDKGSVAEGWYLDEIRVTKKAAIVLDEEFEKGFPGSLWSVGDSQTAGTPAYWSAVTRSLFGTMADYNVGYMAYCAGVGYSGDSDHPYYRDNMTAYMKTAIDLTGASSATLSFWYGIPSIEKGVDHCRVYIGTTKVWDVSASTSKWTKATIDLSSFVGTKPILKFEFYSGSASGPISLRYEGWYLDSILVTKAPAIRPELVVQSVTSTPQPATQGAAVEFKVTVKNQGPVSCGSFNLGFWSNRSTMPGSSDTPTYNTTISSLAAGATAIRTFSVTAGTPGAYRAWAYVDRLNTIVESNEVNNAGPALGRAWSVIGGGSAVRSVLGPAVTLDVTLDPFTSLWTLEELIPPGVTPDGITGPNGSWDKITRKITWSGTSDSPATLNYVLVGAAGTYSISGQANFDGGIHEPVAGSMFVSVLSAGQFCFGANSYTAQEGIKRTVFVKRINGSSGMVWVKVAMKPKTALAWQDYIPKSLTLTWASGDASTKAIKINIPADGKTEADELFQVVLKAPFGASLVAPYKTSITIAGNSKTAQDDGDGWAIGMARLTDTLDGEALTWFTSTASPWTGQKFVTADGVDAAISGSTTLDQVSWLQTEVEGAGLLSFDWLVKGAGSESCLLVVDGQIARTLRAGDEWANESLALGEGDHTVRWVFVGEGLLFRGSAYLDRVAWTPDAE